MSRIGSTLSAAVAMALASSAMLGRAFRTVLPDVHKSFTGEVTLAPMTYGHKGPGISMAQQKRASLKKRNRAKHKARC